MSTKVTPEQFAAELSRVGNQMTAAVRLTFDMAAEQLVEELIPRQIITSLPSLEMSEPYPKSWSKRTTRQGVTVGSTHPDASKIERGYVSEDPTLEDGTPRWILRNAIHALGPSLPKLLKKNLPLDR